MKKWFCFTVAIISLLLSGCNCFRLPCGDLPCCDNRRPAVIEKQRECVIDYEDVCPLQYEAPFSGMDSEPVTAEMLDPYQPLDPNYKLSVGDVLEISVWEDEETRIENAVVAPDGRLYYGILDGVEAAERSLQDVKEELAANLKDYYSAPRVVIVPKSGESQTIRVLGRVRQPGLYPLQAPLTLRDAVGMAGGLISQTERNDVDNVYLNIPYVDLESSFLVRNDRRIDIDFRKVLLEGDTEHNIYLRPGDYIYIHPEEKREVFVLGGILAPQRIPHYNGMTLIGALTAAGGWPLWDDPYSPDLKRVIVIRGSLECPCVAQVNVWKILDGEARDLVLQPGDIVYAQNKQFRLGRELVRLAISAFVQAFSVGAASHFAGSHWFDTVIVE